MLVNINFIRTLTLLCCLLPLGPSASSPIESGVADSSTQYQQKCVIAEPLDDLAKQLNTQVFKLLGKAKFSFLFWDVYDSKLLTSDGRHPFSNSCQYSLFEIKYLRDISKKELIENTVAQWQHLALDENEYRSFVPLLENIWPDIKAGDQLSMFNQMGVTSFYLNEKRIGDIESLTFAKAFLSIWLDKNTSEPKLRKKLLGVVYETSG